MDLETFSNDEDEQPTLWELACSLDREIRRKYLSMPDFLRNSPEIRDFALMKRKVLKYYEANTEGKIHPLDGCFFVEALDFFNGHICLQVCSREAARMISILAILILRMTDDDDWGPFIEHDLFPA